MEPKVIIIACVREHDQAIGAKGDLFFQIKADMEFFVEKTKGNTVVMGRKNWESIPPKYRPLVDRKNVVISRNMGLEVPDNVYVTHSLEGAITMLRKEDRDIFIIGGGEIYQQVLDKELADEVYLSVISGTDDRVADTFFHTNEGWKKQFQWKKIIVDPSLHFDRKSKENVVMTVFHYIR